MTSQSSDDGGVPSDAPQNLSGAVVAVVQRDLRLALRRPGDTLQPLGFFVIVSTLFPLALQPELSLLRDILPAALWVGALLSSLLALDLLFREDAQDGTLEQLALCGLPFTELLAAKTAVHWLLTGLPLVLIAPLVATALGAPMAAVPGILAALLLGTVALSLIGAVGAGLTMSMKRNGSLLALLVLPLAVPVLIFGARATELAIAGESMAAPLYLLAAMSVLAVDAGAVGRGRRSPYRPGVNMNWVWFHRFGSPPYFYRLAKRLVPWFAWLGAGAVRGRTDRRAGIRAGRFSPGRRLTGSSIVHVPAAWLSLQVYVVMAASAAIGLIWRMKVAHAVAASCATIGASFTVVALGTGMLWGKPMWGTYWAWDPRLTSELLLLFLYLGYMGLRSGFDDTARADRASARARHRRGGQRADHPLLGGLVELAAPGLYAHRRRRHRCPVDAGSRWSS